MRIIIWGCNLLGVGRGGSCGASRRKEKRRRKGTTKGIRGEKSLERLITRARLDNHFLNGTDIFFLFFYRSFSNEHLTGKRVYRAGAFSTADLDKYLTATRRLYLARLSRAINILIYFNLFFFCLFIIYLISSFRKGNKENYYTIYNLRSML